MSNSMTNKEPTIINGVDVSRCKHKCTSILNPVTLRCENTEPRCRGGYDGFCKENPNCYYKQSARKDERIKELEEEKKKGLQEYNNIGGCWGCGLQLSLNQYLKDIENHQQKLSQIAQLADKCKVQQCSKKTCGYLDDSTDDLGFLLTNEQSECRYILMQSTGLKDKNDKLIFEGDIVNGANYDRPYSQHSDIGKILFCSETCKFVLKQPDNWHTIELDKEYCKNMEVIGNIYENPELLKDKE